MIFIKKQLIISLCLSLFLGFNFSEAQSKRKRKKNAKTEQVKPKETQKKKGQFKDYDKVITEDAITDEGLFKVHQVDEKYFFEIPNSYLDTDMLLVSRFSKLPTGLGGGYVNAGTKTNTRLIRWERFKDKILIKERSYSAVADDSLPINISVQNNNYEPIIFAFDIQTISKDSSAVVVDVSSFYGTDVKAISGLPARYRQQYKVRNLDKSRSFINSMKSFPKNIEVIQDFTYNAAKPPSNGGIESISIQMNQSMILLPKDKMQPRYFDERVGWFTLSKYDYSSEKLKADRKTFIRRWRLVPKDIEAYKRGELVEPLKPIVYYLDPATPEKFRSYMKEGVELWKKAFEAAGFKNAIIAKEPPTKEEDPDFSPEDIRYSVIRYVASTTRNATGPSVSDPRTGEIIESDIIWYHNHLRSYRNRYLLETGAANPKARTLNTPEKEIGEMMRRVISHEVGHALGLPHNMKASSAYPVDSLRSGTFTQKMGIATTIMDYARYNYVAQPGDQNIRFVRQLGPYDDYAIEWGYRYFGNKKVEEETKILKAYIDKKSLNPIYMFGGRGNDPNSQTENIGDDPVKASNYGIKNLKIVAKNLAEWTLSESSNYDDLEELYGEMIGVYRRYIYHVHRIVGGVETTFHNSNQNEVFTYTNTSKVDQIKALNFLNKELWNTPKWLIDKSLISNIKAEGGLYTIQNLQRSALNRLLSKKLLNRMLSTSQTLVGNGLQVNILLQKLFDQIFVSRSKPDSFERALQLNFIAQIKSLTNDDELQPEIKASLKMLKKDIHKWSRSKKYAADKILKAHFQFCFQQSNED